jgi:very-short-patch-repair endonuclease
MDDFGLVYRREYRISRIHVDFAFPEQKLAVECDGYRYHMSPIAQEKDAKRDEFLASVGWRVMRFTSQEINADAMACARKIRAALR